MYKELLIFFIIYYFLTFTNEIKQQYKLLILRIRLIQTCYLKLMKSMSIE